MYCGSCCVLEFAKSQMLCSIYYSKYVILGKVTPKCPVTMKQKLKDLELYEDFQKTGRVADAVREMLFNTPEFKVMRVSIVMVISTIQW